MEEMLINTAGNVLIVKKSKTALKLDDSYGYVTI
jgi:hypothetical protein